VKKIKLGNSKLNVSESCLGSMTFGDETNETDSFAIMDNFVQKGGNFIDTANMYSKGVSEKIIGKWLRNKKREDLVIATKQFWSMSNNSNINGSNRKQINNDLEDSLKRLQTDYIDLYYVHFFDVHTPLEETYNALNDLVNEGKIRNIGVSNYTAYQFQKTLDICDNNNFTKPIVFQPFYNLMVRSIEYEILPLCMEEKITILPWSPLFGGWLSGKYYRGMKPPENTRVSNSTRFAWEKYNTEKTWLIIDELTKIAKELGKTVAQVALRWIVERPGKKIPILGVRTIKQLEDNLGAFGWTLNQNQMDRLNKVSKIDVNYPYNFMIEFGPKEYKDING